jgi:hypothetical protein
MQIDETIINYLTEIINPTVEDNNTVVKVPVLYATPERWKSVQKDGFVRDKKNGKLQTPLITIRRTGVVRNNMTNPSNKYLYMSHQAQWNPRVSYDRFAVQNNIRPSLELRNVIVPDYVDINYDVLLWTTYVEQMNKLVEQINAENEEFWGLRNQYKFRVRIEEYQFEDQLRETQERLIRNRFQMKVSAYLVPEKHIRNFAAQSANAKQFTVKKIVTITEKEGKLISE